MFEYFIQDENGANIPVVVRLSWRAKRFSIKVQDGKVVGVLPTRRTRDHEKLLSFIRANQDWILKQLRKRKRSFEPLIPSPCLPGAILILKGEKVPFILSESFPGAKTGIFRFVSDGEVRLPMGLEDYEKHLELAFKRYMGSHLPDRMGELSRMMQVHFNRLTVRTMRSKWGSCNARGNISINWRIIHAPVWIQDYLIIHELAHLKQMNHSPRFWAVVAQYCSRYKEARNWLSNCELAHG